jgi:peptidylprolyl isomerase
MPSLRPIAVYCSVLLVLAACGDSGSSADTSSTAATPTTAFTKPSVAVPSVLPTNLVITDLNEGAGTPAAVGDVVIVHYVGVRSATGEEFDNSYDRGQPLEVLLGANKVIPGWEEGLIGARQGGRRQLDIPADLAYGDSPPEGGPILPGDALTFVLDVVAVLPTSDAADEPQVTIGPAANIKVLQSTDLIVGSGASPADGQNVAIHIVSFRADTGERLNSDWGAPPLKFSYSAKSDVYPGLLAAVKGMQLGGRRQVQIPYSLMFDGKGSDGLGLPPSIDLVVVIDLIDIY